MKVRVHISHNKTKTIKSMPALLQLCGWTSRGGNHSVWFCPCGEHTITLASTPRSGGRHNDISRAKKCKSVSEKVVA
jgi:hypothetical protein